MLNSPDETVLETDKVVASPPDTTIPEIKAHIPEIKPAVPEIKPQPRDAFLGPVPLKVIEQASPPKKSSRFKRLLRHGSRAALAVICLGGLAWAAKSYYPGNHMFLDTIRPHPAADVQASTANDEAGTVKEMAAEIRALKASVDALSAAHGNGTANAEDRENLQKQLNTVQTTTSAALAALTGRVDKLEAESTTKLSQIGAQIDGIEHRITPRNVSISGKPPRKRVEHPHDAFDPSRDPAAPGAPRPLGSLVTASPISPHAR